MEDFCRPNPILLPLKPFARLLAWYFAIISASILVSVSRDGADLVMILRALAANLSGAGRVIEMHRTCVCVCVCVCVLCVYVWIYI